MTIPRSLSAVHAVHADSADHASSDGPAVDEGPAVCGVYLRPDVRTSMAVSTITFHVERQFGLVSAGAYPPHATLAGSVPIAAPESAVIAALDTVLADRPGFPVHNAGIVTRSVVAYDVDGLPDGSINEPLRRLAVDVNAVLAPLAVPLDAYLVEPFVAERFHAHLSLASHELLVRPEWRSEVDAFIRQLDVWPSRWFPAEHVTLYRFTSADWTGQWWRSLEWEPLTTWTLGETRQRAAAIGDAREAENRTG